MVPDIETCLLQLRQYIESEEYKGYDPYDALSGWFPHRIFGRWGQVLAIQFQKRNPVNIRLLQGIKKEINPKAMGLLLEGYSALYKTNPNEEYKKRADYLFRWLAENYSKGYSGHCWGYNFDWASPVKYLEAYTPTVVVTAFVAKGIFEYYRVFESKEAADILQSACNFITTDLPVTETGDGLCFSYSPQAKDVCYNASLLGAETLAMAHSITKKQRLLEMATKAMDFVIARQHGNGRWNYSLNSSTGKERNQIDFHQGYVLNSIYEYVKITQPSDAKYLDAVKKGAEFYRNEQFFENGRSKWRLPKTHPTDVHNQAQGIITFALLKDLNPGYLPFAKTVAGWTIQNMQHNSGCFHYRKNRLFTNRISYMRWSQAWMLLALARLQESQKETG